MVMCRLSLAAVLLVLALRPVHAETGIAAFYGGGRTANGEVSGPNGFTAAHRTLPFGTCSVNEANRASIPGDRRSDRPHGERPPRRGWRRRSASQFQHDKIISDRNADRAFPSH